MKKFLLLLISFLGLTLANFTFASPNFIYTPVINDQMYYGPIYLSTGSISTGSSFVPISGYRGFWNDMFFSSDGRYIYYPNYTYLSVDNFITKVYKKDITTGTVTMVFSRTGPFLSFLAVSDNYMYFRSYNESYYYEFRVPFSNTSDFQTVDGGSSICGLPVLDSYENSYYVKGSSIYKRSSTGSITNLGINVNTCSLAISSDGRYLFHTDSVSGAYTKRDLISGGITYSSLLHVIYSSIDNVTNTLYIYNSSDKKIYSTPINDFVNFTPVMSFSSSWRPVGFKVSGGITGATCSDGIKNQNETSIDYGGVCSCYVRDVLTGKTLLPYGYSGTIDNSYGTILSEELVFDTRDGYSRTSISDLFSVGNRRLNWYVHANNESSTGSLVETLSGFSGAYVRYEGSPVLNIETYPGVSFGDENKTNIESIGSNAPNYLRLATDKGWHLEARFIKNTVSSGYDYSEDFSYTRIESNSGVAYLPPNTWTRDFKVVFDSPNPIIALIEWGSYTRTISSQSVCSTTNSTTVVDINGNVTTKEEQKELVDNTSDLISRTILSQTGSMLQTDYTCPSDVENVVLPGMGWIDWGFFQHVPLIDYDLNIKPFSGIACSLKAGYLLISKFQ